MQTEAAECQKNEDKGISSPDCDGSSKSLDSISIVFVNYTPNKNCNFTHGNCIFLKSFNRTLLQ